MNLCAMLSYRVKYSLVLNIITLINSTKSSSSQVCGPRCIKMGSLMSYNCFVHKLYKSFILAVNQIFSYLTQLKISQCARDLRNSKN